MNKETETERSGLVDILILAGAVMSMNVKKPIRPLPFLLSGSAALIYGAAYNTLKPDTYSDQFHRFHADKADLRSIASSYAAIPMTAFALRNRYPGLTFLTPKTPRAVMASVGTFTVFSFITHCTTALASTLWRLSQADEPLQAPEYNGPPPHVLHQEHLDEMERAGRISRLNKASQEHLNDMHREYLEEQAYYAAIGKPSPYPNCDLCISPAYCRFEDCPCCEK